MSGQDWIRLVILSILWGGSFFFVEVALEGLPVLSLVWARVALAAGLLAVVLIATRTAFPQGKRVWTALLVMGLLNNAVPFTLFVAAQGQISGGLAAILNATTPLWGVVLAHLLTEEKVSRSKKIGLAAGFLGVVVMMGGKSGGTFWASFACLSAAFSYGLAGIWGRRFKAMGLSPLTTAFGQVCCSSLILLPIWLWVDQPWAVQALPSARVVGAVLGLAALSTALAYLLYFRLLASAGPTNLLLVTFLVPVSAAALGMAFLKEQLTPNQLAGFVLIAMGLAAIDGRLLRRFGWA